jgi:hypothetical protein
MRPLLDFHHYSSAHAAPRRPIEALEERVVALLTNAPLPDAARDSSVCFELKHSSAVTQFSRLLAAHRGLPVDTCAAGGLLHDIYVITSGSYTDHAHRGAPIAVAMLEDVGGFAEDEIENAERIVRHHSDKHVWSDDPFAEFGKDVDVLDAFLYPGAFDWYLANKPLDVFQHYLARAARMWTELGVPFDARFHLLDDYGGGWLDASCPVQSVSAASGPTVAVPPCLLVRDSAGWTAHFNERRWCAVAQTSTTGDAVSALASTVPLDGPGSADAMAYMLWPAIDRFEALKNDDHGRRRLATLLPGVRV